VFVPGAQLQCFLLAGEKLLQAAAAPRWMALRFPAFVSSRDASMHLRAQQAEASAIHRGARQLQQLLTASRKHCSLRGPGTEHEVNVVVVSAEIDRVKGLASVTNRPRRQARTSSRARPAGGMACSALLQFASKPRPQDYGAKR